MTFAFVRTGAAPLYYASTDGGSPLLTVAFLPAASQQASYTLEQAWAAGGCYLFLSAPPTDPTGFVSTVQAYLQSVVATRFLWVNPNTAGALQATPWVVQGGTGLLPVTFAFNSVSLAILGGVLVTPAPGQPGFNIALNGDQAAYLQTQSGGQLGAPITGLYLPLWGDQAGTLQFPTQLGAADLDANGLDHALRYWTDNAVISGLLATQRFPLFALSGSERIAVAATMDPLAPLVGNRTHFALGSGAIPSCFCTPDGAAIALTPAATGQLTGPRLVFANNPAQLNSADPPNFYLVPEGGFTLNTPSALQADGAPSRLLLGMSGSEYVRFVPGEDVLAFTPNQPAFNVAAPAPDGKRPRTAARPRAVAANEPPDISPYLSDKQGQVTTAWARGLGALGYSPLHMPPETTQPTTQNCTYALLFTLDLGTPGALVAAAVGFQATILAGWQQTGNTILGFRLPLLTGATQLTIQGVLQLYLGKYSLDYVAVPPKTKGEDPTQLLGIRFDSFNLEILGDIYPASVTTDPAFRFNFMLFAPPPGNAIAWYAALKLDLPA